MKPRLAIAISLLLAAAAWACLAGIVRQFQPTPRLMGAALGLAVIAVAATTMPFWYALQRRLARGRHPRILVGSSVREGLWTGLFVGALLVLRYYDLLNGVLVLVIALALFLLETFLRQRSAGPPAAASRRQMARLGKTSGGPNRQVASPRTAPKPPAPNKAGGKPAAAGQRTGKGQPAPKSPPKSGSKP